ncbi:MAG: hypothetical protein R3F02_15570 [Thiolinea sp.]
MISHLRNHFSVASIALFLGGLLWVAAFWLPVFETEQRNIAGYWIFLTGWMGFAIFQFAWYANLLLLVAVILMYSSPIRATLFAALGLLVATQAFWFDALPETTESVEIIGRGAGFWLWYAGIFLMSLGVFFCSDSDEVTEVTEEAGSGQDQGYQPLPPQGTMARAEPEAASANPASTATEPATAIAPAVEPDLIAARTAVMEKAPPPKSALQTEKAQTEQSEPESAKETVSLLAQLESVRQAKRTTMAQQERAQALSDGGQKQQSAEKAVVVETVEDTHDALKEEDVEHTLPAVKAILAAAVFSGNEKAGSHQQLPAFFMDREDGSVKT